MRAFPVRSVTWVRGRSQVAAQRAFTGLSGRSSIRRTWHSLEEEEVWRKAFG
jgi:hypothetical protein